MRYIFENENSKKDKQKEINNFQYFKWMKMILRRSDEILSLIHI